MIGGKLRSTVVLGAVLIVVSACVSVKPNALYIDNSDSGEVSFYNSSEIYADYFTSEGWATQSEGCISLKTTKEAAYQGTEGIDVSWNKTKEGCPWLGFGFGWDNWTGKDLSSIKFIGALQFHVRLLEGERKSLPWAVGLEDFTGAQAWLGVTSNAVKAEKISTEWTRIEMPISEFNWEEQEANISNIKQIIFNTEAEGHVYIDEIKIVPYDGGFRKRANIETLKPSQFTVDGRMDDDIWKTPTQSFGHNEVHLALIDTFLCVALKVKDETPLQNKFTGKDIYQGDAFELAFSTIPDARTKRTNFLSTDQQIGFALSKNGINTWDWRKDRELQYKEFIAVETEDGYLFEAKIRLSDLEASLFEKGQLYGLEIAVDHGTTKGRITQERWNDAANSTFHENPSLWGEMYILDEEQVMNDK